jgi:hypothetical protein
MMGERNIEISLSNGRVLRITEVALAQTPRPIMREYLRAYYAGIWRHPNGGN